MSDVPNIRNLPYVTNKQCVVCQPKEDGERHRMMCKAEYPRSGTIVERMLECSNPGCETQEQDVYDTASGRVIMDKDAERNLP